MASITRHAKGWRAQVCRKGVRRSKVMPTRREAADWAARAEYEIVNARLIASNAAFGDVLDRYAREVSPTKRGHRWEMIRLEKLRRDRIAGIAIGALATTDLADWRDRRLREVSAASVTREMNLLGAVLTQARREWEMIDRNPMSDVRRPATPPARERMPSGDEFERLAVAAGDDLSSPSARAHQAFLFACETAMRAGEIAELTWDRIDLERRIVKLVRTKNGHAREVPLSKQAVRLLEELPQADPAFGLTSKRLDVLFRKLKARAVVEGLHFHDSRRFATSRLSRKLDVLTLAKVTGHRDLKILLNVYYKGSSEDMVRKLDV